MIITNNNNRKKFDVFCSLFVLVFLVVMKYKIHRLHIILYCTLLFIINHFIF